MIRCEDVFINGDGETSRDFGYIEMVFQVKHIAATSGDEATDRIYTVAVFDKTALDDFLLNKKVL